MDRKKKGRAAGAVAIISTLVAAGALISVNVGNDNDVTETTIGDVITSDDHSSVIEEGDTIINNPVEVVTVEVPVVVEKEITPTWTPEPTPDASSEVVESSATAEPTPSATATQEPTPTATAASSNTPTPAPPTPKATLEPTPTPSATAVPEPSPQPDPTPTATSTPAPSPSPTETPTATPENTPTPVPTATPTISELRRSAVAKVLSEIGFEARLPDQVTPYHGETCSLSDTYMVKTRDLAPGVNVRRESDGATAAVAFAKLLEDDPLNFQNCLNMVAGLMWHYGVKGVSLTGDYFTSGPWPPHISLVRWTLDDYDGDGYPDDPNLEDVGIDEGVLDLSMPDDDGMTACDYLTRARPIYEAHWNDEPIPDKDAADMAAVCGAAEQEN